MRDRPVSVVVATALAMITGLFSFCAGVGSLFVLSVSTFGSLIGIGEPSGLGLALFRFGWGAATVFAGYWLWKLKPWARVATILLQGISLVFAVLAIFLPPAIPWIPALLAVLIILILLRSGTGEDYIQ